MKEPIIARSQTDTPQPITATGESFGIHEWSGSGPDYIHVHYSDDEAWHILEGTLTFRFTDREVEAAVGTTVFVPAGVPHTYYEANGPTRYIIILTPRLRALIQELQSSPYAQHAEIMQRYDSAILP